MLVSGEKALSETATVPPALHRHYTPALTLHPSGQIVCWSLGGSATFRSDGSSAGSALLGQPLRFLGPLRTRCVRPMEIDETKRTVLCDKLVCLLFKIDPKCALVQLARGSKSSRNMRRWNMV